MSSNIFLVSSIILIVIFDKLKIPAPLLSGTLVASGILQIFDITGRLVEPLIRSELEPGTHEIQWNASNHPSGIYFVVFNLGDKVVSQKLVYLK